MNQLKHLRIENKRPDLLAFEITSEGNVDGSRASTSGDLDPRGAALVAVNNAAASCTGRSGRQHRGRRLVTSRKWPRTRSTLGYTSKISETVGLSQTLPSHLHTTARDQHSHSLLANLISFIIGFLFHILEESLGVHSYWVPGS